MRRRTMSSANHPLAGSLLCTTGAAWLIFYLLNVFPREYQFQSCLSRVDGALVPHCVPIGLYLSQPAVWVGLILIGIGASLVGLWVARGRNGTMRDMSRTVPPHNSTRSCE